MLEHQYNSTTADAIRAHVKAINELQAAQEANFSFADVCQLMESVGAQFAPDILTVAEENWPIAKVIRLHEAAILGLAPEFLDQLRNEE